MNCTANKYFFFSYQMSSRGNFGRKFFNPVQCRKEEKSKESRSSFELLGTGFGKFF